MRSVVFILCPAATGKKDRIPIFSLAGGSKLIQKLACRRFALTTLGEYSRVNYVTGTRSMDVIAGGRPASSAGDWVSTKLGRFADAAA
jgi:hypothetical protein